MKPYLIAYILVYIICLGCEKQQTYSCNYIYENPELDADLEWHAEDSIHSKKAVQQAINAVPENYKVVNTLCSKPLKTKYRSLWSKTVWLEKGNEYFLTSRNSSGGSNIRFRLYDTDRHILAYNFLDTTTSKPVKFICSRSGLYYLSISLRNEDAALRKQYIAVVLAENWGLKKRVIKGSSHIFLVQKLLKNRGYNLNVNGKVDSLTRCAILTFQKDNNLPSGIHALLKELGVLYDFT